MTLTKNSTYLKVGEINNIILHEDRRHIQKVRECVISYHEDHQIEARQTLEGVPDIRVELSQGGRGNQGCVGLFEAAYG